ncbi:hypothetical protein EP47_00935, partial [Legionella norrlandica]
MTKLFNRRILLNSFMILLLVLQGGINLASYWRIQQLLITNHTVLYTQQVIYVISELRYHMLEMQNNLRGYVITGNPIHLDDYKKKTQLAYDKIAELKQLVHNNKNQSKRLEHLSVLLQQRVEFFNHILAVYQKEGEKAAGSILASDKGLYFADQIRILSMSMQNEELNLLKTANHALQENSATTKYYLIAVNISSLILIGLFLLIFNWQYSRAVQINRRRRQTENQLKGIIAATNDGIAAMDTNYNLIVSNQAFERCFFQLLGKSISQGCNLKELQNELPQEQQFLLRQLDRTLKGENLDQIHEVISSQLAPNIYEITYNAICDIKGEIKGVALVAREVTDRIKLEKAMKQANEQLAFSMAELKQHNEAILLLNRLNSALQSCLSVEETFNPITTYVKKILPFAAGQLYLAHPSRNYLDLVVGWGEIQAKNEMIISPEQCWALRRGQNHRFHHAENSIFCEHLKQTPSVPSYLCIPLQAQNDNVGLLYLELKNTEKLSETEFNQLVNQQESLIINISESIASSIANIKLRDALRVRSIRDPLTGLYNRSYLEECFSREIQRAKRHNAQLAIVMMDLDHFKTLNDTYGHDAGDLALIEVSKLLQQEIRQSDIACRY